MFILELAIKNKMSDAKKYLQSLNVVSSVGLALIIPVVLFRMFRAVCLKKGYNDLIGKVVVITGASSGLGEALAHAFYKHGCQVVLCARRREELERVRTDLLQTHSTVTAHPPIIIPLDLSDIESLPGHVEKIVSITGKIDILVNNGGVAHRGLAVNTQIEVDMKIMTVNYFGSVALTKAILPGMIKQKSSHIVFVSSIQGLMAIPERSAYAASKHALQAFGDSLRAEVAHKNISVTTVSPGYIRTNLSLNALTESGKLHGQMDETTESGYEPDYVAERIVGDVARKIKEDTIVPLVPKVALYLRKYLPSIYFVVMEQRARKLQKLKKKS